MKIKKYLLLVLAVVLLFTFAGCGAKSEASEDVYYTNASSEAPGELAMETDSKTQQALPTNRKLIKTVRMTAETEALDALLAGLDAKIAELGGYAERREVYNGSSRSQRRYRSAELTIRIPEDRLADFVSHVQGSSNIVSSSESVEDITLAYVDTESRISALKTEEARLLELMEQAKDLDDLLSIEQRLTEVRYELERYGSQLRTYDNLVNYATVYLSINEVQEYTEVEEATVWQRISGGFVKNLKGVGNGLLDLLIWILASSPYLVVFGAAGFGVAILLRRRRKAKANKTVPPENKE